MYIERTVFYTLKECHKTDSLQNHTATPHKEKEGLGDRRNVGESSCITGDGMGQMAQPLMFMMMMTYLTLKFNALIPISLVFLTLYSFLNLGTRYVWVIFVTTLPLTPE
jgi:hypothetical protein